VLPKEKIKFNIRKLVHSKDKSQKIKLVSDNRHQVDISTKTIGAVPSLKDMEFNWIEDY
jgi:hypothetical protein